ncbi:hypothetical protein O3G_MSEX003927 [Manduca sexta]|uniref:Saposin B-type domain-containing protein n=1 Tax=Manduca sexta TaxID=7130 RepID=A0A921YU95_MANSE|nr:hypothetical protein O3G_MSEX003927 [Manduca sexta]
MKLPTLRLGAVCIFIILFVNTSFCDLQSSDAVANPPTIKPSTLQPGRRFWCVQCLRAAAFLIVDSHRYCIEAALNFIFKGSQQCLRGYESYDKSYYKCNTTLIKITTSNFCDILKTLDKAKKLEQN